MKSRRKWQIQSGCPPSYTFPSFSSLGIHWAGDCIWANIIALNIAIIFYCFNHLYIKSPIGSSALSQRIVAMPALLWGMQQPQESVPVSPAEKKHFKAIFIWRPLGMEKENQCFAASQILCLLQDITKCLSSI